MVVLSLQLFLQLWLISDRVVGTDTSMSQNTFKNLIILWFYYGSIVNTTKSAESKI